MGWYGPRGTCGCCGEPPSSSSSSAGDPCECNNSGLRIQLEITSVLHDTALANNGTRATPVFTSCGTMLIGNAEFSGLSGLAGTYILDLEKKDPCVGGAANMFQNKDYYFLGSALTVTWYGPLATAQTSPNQCLSQGDSVVCSADTTSSASWVRIRHLDGVISWTVTPFGRPPGAGGAAPPSTVMDGGGGTETENIQCPKVFPITASLFGSTTSVNCRGSNVVQGTVTMFAI
jgi:hypothetical protein